MEKKTDEEQGEAFSKSKGKKEKMVAKKPASKSVFQ